MDKRIFLTTFVLVLLLAAAALGQSTGITIATSPAGAEVTLIGDVIVTGVSPVTFRQGLTGHYVLTCVRPGYETYNSKVVVDPTQLQEVNVNLSPKTRFKAAARSLFFPGWGQRYSDQKSKGLLFQIGVIGAGVAFLIADNNFQSKNDDYETARADYLDATTFAEQEATWNRMKVAQKDAYDAEDTRRLTIGVGVGLWALNFLDALLFFPENRETFSYKGVALTPQTDNQRVGFALSARF